MEAGSRVVLKVQFRDAQYQVVVPEYLCRRGTADMTKLVQLVCEADPKRAAIASTLAAFTFEKAPWTIDNIEALLEDRLIVLAENGMLRRADCDFEDATTMLILHFAVGILLVLQQSTGKLEDYYCMRHVCDAAVRSIPTERKIEWQSLPAVRILTDPQAMPGKLSLS